MIRLFNHLGTVLRLRAAEEASLRHYLEVIVPRGEFDWDVLYEHEVKRDLYHGMGAPPRYSSREGYEKRVRRDFDGVRKSINSFLVRGILALSPECYDLDAICTLADGLYVKRSWAEAPLLATRLASLIPIIHQTTRDVGIPAYVSVGSGIPAVVLTSTFSGTLLRIFRLLVRRTFLEVSDDGLQLRFDIYDVAVLQRHARVLYHLLGIWIVGEPHPTPELDEASRTLAFASGDPQRTGEGHAILWLKTGWCLFEALHEYSHILRGDWLRAPKDREPEDEIIADLFAINCLLLEDEPTVRVWMLHGAVLFLGCLRLAEEQYGNTGHHPGAAERVGRLFKFLSARLTGEDHRLFTFLGALHALPLFCHLPSDCGADRDDRFGA